MDPRFEPEEQRSINAAITYLNQFVKENSDRVITDQHLSDDIQFVMNAFYHFAEEPISHLEVEELLSEKNLLSTDTVALPVITELKEWHNKKRILKNYAAKLMSDC